MKKKFIFYILLVVCKPANFMALFASCPLGADAISARPHK